MFSMPHAHQPRLLIDDHLPNGTPSTLADDVRSGLALPCKTLPPKYFYDDLGSALFDRICDQIEYYPTRTEHALLARIAGRLLSILQPTDLIELGSGAARKTRVVLDAAERAGLELRYVPLDVNATMLRESAEALLDRYPWLQVHGVVTDYEQHLAIPDGARRLVLYLGGTIGNFLDLPARRFLRSIAHQLRPGDHLLLGADLVKSTDLLNAAYNDRAGITADFNLNMLRVLNRELDADFDLEAFEHVAFFNERLSQIEMHLRSRRAQQIHLRALDLTVRFEAGELLCTEVSRKFTRSSLSSLLEDCGFALREWYTPENNFFALALAAVAPRSGASRAGT
jgi:L-histidine N-alpha-methyltransferase